MFVVADFCISRLNARAKAHYRQARCSLLGSKTILASFTFVQPRAWRTWNAGRILTSTSTFPNTELTCHVFAGLCLMSNFRCLVRARNRKRVSWMFLPAGISTTTHADLSTERQTTCVSSSDTTPWLHASLIGNHVMPSMSST